MNKKDIARKVLVELSRLLLGITFTFSGFVKAVDPYGSSYKIQDYISIFGFDSLLFIALPVAILLCVLEFSVGIFMLLGIYRKWNSRVVLLIMSFMTPFTLYLAITNPVSDCGCFGDAWIITNWQTFFKNILLLAAAITAFIYHQKIQNFYTGKFYWLIALFVFTFATVFSLINCYFEPVFDFRPYKIGADLPKLINVDESKRDVYENVFVYEKEGVQKEFTEDNYPWQDTTWVFVDRINKLIKEGEKPAITDFIVNRLYFNAEKSAIESEENITSEILEDENYVFLMIAYSLPKMRESAITKLEDVKNYANDHNYKFYCLSSSTKDEIVEWEKENLTGFDFCFTDERALKTMMRTNPGLMLLKNGVIINKWSPAKAPVEKSLTKPLEELSYSRIPDMKKTNRETIWETLALLITPLLLIKILDFLIYRKRLPGERKSKKTDN
ncbi:BT_3928 family protein [Viscerimonas tarda]